MVIENEVNFTIGYTPQTVLKDLYMTSSYAYYTSNLMWSIPPGRLYSSFEKLFQPFKRIVWLCTSVVFISSFLVVIAMKFQPKNHRNFLYGRGTQTPCLNIVNIFFGGSLSRLPMRNFARSILCIFMLYCLVIRSSYQGALFKFMQMNTRDIQVESIEEMLAKNFSFYILDSSREFINEIPNVMTR